MTDKLADAEQASVLIHELHFRSLFFLFAKGIEAACTFLVCQVMLVPTCTFGSRTTSDIPVMPALLFN